MSELYIKTEYDENQTVISDSFFTSPCKVAKPFKRGSGIEIMVMMASAGMLDGDRYNIRYDIGGGCAVKITGQSYTKLFKCEHDKIKQDTSIYVGDGAALYYAPCPIVPFGGSVFEANTSIYLEESSKLVLCDILSCGRSAMGERLEFTSYKSKIKVYSRNKLVFMDHTRLVPSEHDLFGTGFFEGRTHAGLEYIRGAQTENIPELDGVEAAVTRAAEGICVRALSDSADDISRLFEIISRNIGIGKIK